MKKSSLYFLILIFTIDFIVDGTTGLILSKGLRPQAPKRSNTIITRSPKVYNIAPVAQLLNPPIKPISSFDNVDPEVSTQNSGKTKAVNPSINRGIEDDGNEYAPISSGSVDQPLFKQIGDSIVPNQAHSIETNENLDGEVQDRDTSKNVESNPNPVIPRENPHVSLQSYILTGRRTATNQESLLAKQDNNMEPDSSYNYQVKESSKDKIYEYSKEFVDEKASESENDINDDLEAEQVVEYRNSSIDNPVEEVIPTSEPEYIPKNVKDEENVETQIRELLLPKIVNTKAEVQRNNDPPPDSDFPKSSSAILEQLNVRYSDSPKLNPNRFVWKDDDVRSEDPSKLQDLQSNQEDNMQEKEERGSIHKEPSLVSFHEKSDKNGKAFSESFEKLEEIDQETTVKSVDNVSPYISKLDTNTNVNVGSDESFPSISRVENNPKIYSLLKVKSIKTLESSGYENKNLNNPKELDILNPPEDKSLLDSDTLSQVSEVPDHINNPESTTNTVGTTNDPVFFQVQTQQVTLDSHRESTELFDETTEVVGEFNDQSIASNPSSEIFNENTESTGYNPRKLSASVIPNSINHLGQSGPGTGSWLTQESAAQYAGSSSPSQGKQELSPTNNFQQRNNRNSFISHDKETTMNNGQRRYGVPPANSERIMQAIARRNVELTNPSQSIRSTPPPAWPVSKIFPNLSRNGRVLINNKYIPRNPVPLVPPEMFQSNVYNPNSNGFPKQNLGKFRSAQNQFTNRNLNSEFEAEAKLSEEVATNFNSSKNSELQRESTAANQTNVKARSNVDRKYGIWKPNIPEISTGQDGALLLAPKTKLNIPLLFRPTSNLPIQRTSLRPAPNSGLFNVIPTNNRNEDNFSTDDRFMRNADPDLLTEGMDTQPIRNSAMTSYLEEDSPFESRQDETEKFQSEDESFQTRNSFIEEDDDAVYTEKHLIGTRKFSPIENGDGMGIKFQSQVPNEPYPYSKQNVTEHKSKPYLEDEHLLSEIDPPATTHKMNDLRSRISDLHEYDHRPIITANPKKTGYGKYDTSRKIIKKFSKETTLPIPKNIFSWQPQSLQTYSNSHPEPLEYPTNDDYPVSGMEKDLSRPESLLRCLRETTKCQSIPEIHNLCFLDCVTTKLPGQRAKRWNNDPPLLWNSLIKSMHWTINFLCTSLNSVSTEIFYLMQRNPGSFNSRSSTIWLQALGPYPLKPVPITKLANTLVSFIIENSNTVFTALRTVTRELDPMRDRPRKSINSVTLMNEKPTCALKNSGHGLIGASGKLMSLFEQNMVLLDVLLPGYMGISSAALVTSRNKINFFSFVKEAMEIILGIECGLVYFSQSEGWPKCEPENRAPILEESEFWPSAKCPPSVVKYIYVFINGTRVPNQEQYQHGN